MSRIKHKPVIINDGDDPDIISVYVGGGKSAAIVSGGGVNYSLRDIDINMELANGDLLEHHINYTFKLANTEELDTWLKSTDQIFIQRCVRKFKLHSIYSNALKGFFFDLVGVFQSAVLDIIELLGFDKEAKLKEYKKIDKKQNLESSSIILYMFGKDENVNNALKKDNPALHSYITDPEKWQYKGWCPLVPDIRFKFLLGFPFEQVFKYLKIDFDFNGIASELKEIKVISPPEKLDNTKEHDEYLSLSYDEKVKKLHSLIKSHEDKLKEWENYYIEAAKQLTPQVELFKKYFRKL
jgi:hypothetical protein